jgi:predicted TIM-barrel fold metal-dependent hydrolase
MIVDVHSHYWEWPRDFNDDFRSQARRAKGGTDFDLTVRFEDYAATATADAVRTIVFGGKAKLSGLWVDDRHVAEFVEQHRRTHIGFMALDPTQPGWEHELEFGHKTLGLRGIKMMPMYAGFAPDDPQYDGLFGYAEKHGLPVLLHTGTTFISQAQLKFTLPRRLDAVATRHPGLVLILAHLGHPYEGECVAVIRKHPNAYADISALHYRPWQLFHSLMLVQEYGVWDKVLFGTDYPFTTVDATVSGLRNLNGMVAGTALPRLDESALERLIHRDPMPLLYPDPRNRPPD